MFPVEIDPKRVVVMYSNYHNTDYNLCQRNLSSCPHQNISLDEEMIPWRGNLSFRVYSPDKPVKYGIKAYMVSDSSNGYGYRVCAPIFINV
jgi:hypothetical protein